MRRVGLNSVRSRLVLLFFVITAAAVGFVYLYVVPQLESNLTTQKISRLQESGSDQENRLRRAMASGLGQTELRSLVDRIAQASSSRVTLLGVREGSAAPSFVIADSEPELGPVAGEFEIATAVSGGGSLAGVESIDGERAATVALAIPESDPTWVALFSASLAEVDDNVDLIRRQILIAGAIALALALAAGFLAARAHSQRLRRLEEAAQKVADGDFATPIPVDSSDELGQLARTFNEMQVRLAELDSARKQFIANASHELRTPIFSLGGFIELLDEEDPDPEVRAEFMRTMREQVQRLTKLTADLLDLSKIDSGAMEIQLRSVNLGELAREAAREFGPAADQRGSRLEVRTPSTAALAKADPDRTRQVIRILLDNALAHSPDGTKVTVTTYNTNSRAELTVSDEGPEIPKRTQARMFERFYTGDAVSGSGLGLAIARELVQRMDGAITVTSSKGFNALTIDFPQARAAMPLGHEPTQIRA